MAGQDFQQLLWLMRYLLDQQVLCLQPVTFLHPREQVCAYGGAGGGRGEGLARYLTETSLTICACFMASAPCEAFLGQPKALLKHLPTHSLWFAQGTMLWHHLVVRLSRTVGEWWHSDNLLRLMPTPAVWLQSKMNSL